MDVSYVRRLCILVVSLILLIPEQKLLQLSRFNFWSAFLESRIAPFARSQCSWMLEFHNGCFCLCGFLLVYINFHISWSYFLHLLLSSFTLKRIHLWFDIDTSDYTFHSLTVLIEMPLTIVMSIITLWYDVKNVGLLPRFGIYRTKLIIYKRKNLALMFVSVLPISTLCALASAPMISFR